MARELAELRRSYNAIYASRILTLAQKRQRVNQLCERECQHKHPRKAASLIGK